MRAALLALKTWAPMMRGLTVAIHSDNRAMVAYLLKEGGTKSPSLCSLTKEIYTIIDRWGISLRPAYLKGVANIEADSLSRGREVREWCLLPRVVDRIVARVGPLHCDLFASQASTLAPLFFTVTKGDSSALGMDALLHDWSQLGPGLFAFPPPQLLPQVLRKVVIEGVDLSLVAPCWEDATWMPELLSLATHPPRKLPLQAVTLGPRGPPPPKETDLKLTLWRLSGRQQPGQAPHPGWRPSSNAPSGPAPWLPTHRRGGPGLSGAGNRVWGTIPLL